MSFFLLLVLVLQILFNNSICVNLHYIDNICSSSHCAFPGARFCPVMVLFWCSISSSHSGHCLFPVLFLGVGLGTSSSFLTLSCGWGWGHCSFYLGLGMGILFLLQPCLGGAWAWAISLSLYLSLSPSLILSLFHFLCLSVSFPLSGFAGAPFR